jgi:hypothetical protein
MKKAFLAILLAAALLLSACGSRTTEQEKIGSAPVTAIDLCVVEPDVRSLMTDGDRAAYRDLIDAVLAHEASVTLSPDTVCADDLLDLLRRSPYGYFLRDTAVDGDTVTFRYAFSAVEQAKQRRQIDDAFLAIVNEDADPSDNELDVILKLYHAVASRIDYDETRTDNKQLGSPLFDYPADEIYKALTEGEALCYGFAYVLRFALLQRGIDCFCVYGQCHAHESGHEWIVFRYDGAWFHCDPAWDRTDDLSPKLLHFGKTDAERTADTLSPIDFASYHTAAYAGLACTDTRFSIFRGIVGFSYLSPHRFLLTDRDGKESVFNTSTFNME